jgi:hypothetical protein
MCHKLFLNCRTKILVPVVMKQALIDRSKCSKLMSFMHPNRHINHLSDAKIDFKMLLQFSIFLGPQVDQFRREMIVYVELISGADVVVREARGVACYRVQIERWI